MPTILCALYLGHAGIRSLPGQEAFAAAAIAGGQGQVLPKDIMNDVSAAAAESLCMGIFVLICSFELRDLRADASGKGHAEAQRHGQGRGSSAWAGSGPGSPKRLRDEDVGSMFGVEDVSDLLRQADYDLAKEHWQIGPLVMMMILLHVIYPSFPISPQVEVGRIGTFLGFLWVVGPRRCLAVVNVEPVGCFRVMKFALVGVFLHICIFFTTDTIRDLIFPNVSNSVDLYQGPRYFHHLLLYLTIRYPAEGSSCGVWAARCVVSAVVFSSAVWKEFLFRGVYLGGLRTKMSFWAANVTVGWIYALAHEPLQLSPHGVLRLNLISGLPMLMGSLWYGYLYHRCNNIVVTVLAHLAFNAIMFWLHLQIHESQH